MATSRVETFAAELKLDVDVLLEQLFVQLVEVLVLVELSEDIFVFHALETPHFLSGLVFQKDLVRHLSAAPLSAVHGLLGSV